LPIRKEDTYETPLVTYSWVAFSHSLKPTLRRPPVKHLTKSINFDELGKKYLKPKIEQSLPDVEVDVEEAEVDLTVKNQIRFRGKLARGSATTFLVSLVSLLITFVTWTILLLK
jgi:hypothetical protein